MISGFLLRHRVAILRRAGTGVFDDRNQEGTTDSVVATVPARIRPKTGFEMAQSNQAGAVVTDHTMIVLPTDIDEGDVIRFDPDDGRRFEVSDVRDAAGAGHHLSVDLRMVEH